MNSLSYYRALVILNGLVPLGMLAWDAYQGQLGANSVNYAIHVTGILSLVFLVISLMMTPLRWVSAWSGWIAFRRALGLYGFFYAVCHVVIYVGFDRELNISSTIHEIWTRRFLQIGAAAVFLMIPLAATSTNAMIQKLGPKRWKLLHRLAYLVAALGVLHYYMLVKSDVRQPLAFAAVVGTLLVSRFGHHYLELRRASTKHNLLAAQAKSAASKSKRNYWSGELKIAATFPETPDVKTFRLTSPDGGPLPFEYLPGQYMNLQLTIDGKRVNRSYTIASSPTRRDACELSIKREPLGTSSRYLHDQLKLGDTIKVSAPAGKFVFTGQEAPQVLLIAGGVGITPLMSITRYLTDRAWTGDVYLLVIAKSEQDIIFHEEIDWLQSRFPQLHVCITLTRVESASMWSGERGRATESLLKRFVPNLLQVPVYLCGPNEMMDATQTLLESMGVPSQQINTEAFVSPGVGSASDEATEPSESIAANSAVSGSTDTVSIRFAKSNVQADISTDITILEAAEDAGVELPYECRSGICGQCKTNLLSGNVQMDSEVALSSAEKASGLILACQAHARSNVVLEA